MPNGLPATAHEDWETQLLEAERLIRWATSVAVIARAQIFAELAREGLSEWAAESLAMVEECSPQGAASRLGWSMTLADDLPVTLHLLREGHLPVSTARMVAEESAGLNHEQCVALEARIWPLGPGTIPSATSRRTGALRRRIRRVLLTLSDRDHQEQIIAAARHGRRVELWPGEPGSDTAVIAATLTAPDAAAVMAHLDECVRASQPADPRLADEIRADAFVELLTGQPSFALWLDQDDRSPLPSAHHWKVSVHVPLDALVGNSSGTGTISKIGPVGAASAAALARAAINAGGRITRLVTDPLSGTLLDTSSLPRQRTNLERPLPSIAFLVESSYRPSQQLADFVRARDQRCQLPGCSIPAARCELDHITAYDHTNPESGGATTAANLVCICKHHHRLKHNKGWCLRRKPNGQLNWTTPSGRTITVAANDPPG